MDIRDSRRAPRAEVTLEEMTAQRAQVRDILAQAQTRAQRSGKPLLIIMGEDHVSPQAALLETMIYQEARAIGVRDIGLELSPEGAHKVEKSEINRMGGMGFGHKLFYHQAQFFGSRVHWVDGLHDELLEAVTRGGMSPQAFQTFMIDRRNINMAANLGNIPRPMLMLMGAGHVDGVAGDPTLRRSHEVVAFDVAAVNTVNRDKDNYPRIHRLSLTGDAGLLPFDRLLDLGLGPLQGPRFRNWAEGMGFKLSRQRATRDMLEAEDVLDEQPNDITANVAMATALYEYNRDEEAGPYMGRALVACGKFKMKELPKACEVAIGAADAVMEGVPGQSEAFINSFRREVQNGLDAARRVTRGSVAGVMPPRPQPERVAADVKFARPNPIRQMLDAADDAREAVGQGFADAKKTFDKSIEDAKEATQEALSNLIPPFMRPKPKPAPSRTPERHS